MTVYRGGWPYRHPPNAPFILNTESPQAKGLVGWWPILGSPGIDNTGGIIRDYSGGGSNGVITSLTSQRDGERGQVLDFAGNNNLIAVDGQMVWTPTAFSVCWWTKPDTLADWNNQVCADNEWGAFVAHCGASGEMWAGTDLANRLTDTHLPAGTMETGKWQFFVFTYINYSIALYKNGLLVASKSGTAAPTAWGGFQIGTSSASTINGLISEARVYDVALSAGEILHQYQTRWDLYRPIIPQVLGKAPVTGEYYQSAAGVLTPVGIILKETSKTFTGSSTLVGSLIKQSQKVFTGATTASGTLIGRAGKVLIGSITASGVLVRSINKSFTGSLTAVGSLVKQTAKLFTGSVTASGVLITVKAALKSIGGSLTPSGILVKQTGKIFTGSLTATGSIVKQTAKAFVGSVTSVGSLATQKIAGGFSQVTGGVLTMSGILVRQTNKQTAGIMTMAGSITRHITKTFTGVLTTVGTLARQILGLPVPETRIYAIESENRIYAIPG